MTQTAEDLFSRAVAAAEAGDASTYEAFLRECIAADPKHAVALFNLGRLLADRDAYAEAEMMLLRSINIQPLVENLTSMADVFEATDRVGKAEKCFRGILRAVPGHAPTLKRFAAFYERNGNTTA